MNRPSHIIDSVDTEGLVKLASDMVRFPSHIPDEGPFGEFLADEMRQLGCYDEVSLQPVVPGRYNVIGIIRGSGGGQNLLLNGHLDIPANFGQWTHDPYEPSIEDGWLYGSGLTDMKGAVACMIKAGEALARSSGARTGDLVVSAVIHHDVCGLGTKFFLDSNDRRFDWCINGEPTDLKVQVAHGGAWQFEIVTKGRAAHSSRQGDGVDAIDHMMTVLSALKTLRFTHEPDARLPNLPRLTVGVIRGGVTASTYAERCTVNGDVRIVPGMTAQSMRADIEGMLRDLTEQYPTLEAEVHTRIYQRPFQVEETSPIVNLVADLHRTVTGQDADVTSGLPVQAYVTDSADIVRHGIPTVVYGPGDWKQTPDERIRIADLVTATGVYAAAAALITTDGLPL